MSTGIVLAGAAALGAYEAGVLDHVMSRVAHDVGKQRLFEVVSGTSAGAINAAAIAAFADRPAWGAARLCETWSGLQLDQILRPSAIELLRAAIDASDLSARLARALRIERARGGLLDPTPLMKLLSSAIPIERIAEHLAAGRLRGIGISATHVATGHATVFYQATPEVTPWNREHAIAVRSTLSVAHAMASAAIPMLLPPVIIDGDLYCDGGLRQMVPMSPSIHLGAQRLLVINPLAPAGGPAEQHARREASTSPLYLAGKALNALFVDRTEVDLARLEQLSNVLSAGRRRYGPGFEAEINAELAAAGGDPLREITALRIGPSRDLGALAGEYAASPALAQRTRGLVSWVLRRLADAGPSRTGDLLSYLLFDGGFAAELVALGRADAARRHEELCAFFASPAS